MQGKVIWLTGLSASGKTTIANEIQTQLKKLGLVSVVLDGDQVREAVGDYNCGHDPESRIRNAYRISRFANMISRQGVIVIVATMSLFHEIHNWNRKNFIDYFEIFVKADLHVLKKRDPKGLYKHLESGEAQNLPGMDLMPEFPKKPDLEIINNQKLESIAPLATKTIYKIFQQ
ncbi:MULTISPECIES: adenylyl-sulfate kinase [unclassified Maridesulfovibrio]|uniref:adenylyl-sulfate kinase n=1 Tax=unclassified Maridesulfovibrio TaxID=2794999 RepID=UPI003B3E73C2